MMPVQQPSASLGARPDAELQRVEQQLAAAVSALAEYEHLRTSRARLAHDLTAAEAHVQHLARELVRERNDVVERTSGVSGFFYALIGDEQLSIEQREAIEAEARLAEATTYRDHLRAQTASLDARLATASESELTVAVARARAAKEEILIRGNHPAGVALQELAVWIQAIEIELIPLDDAVAAGERALAKLQAVVDALDRARDEKLDQADARGLAGEAQAAITVFHRAIDALATAEDVALGALVSDADREPFADRWIRALVAKGDRTARLQAARSEILARRERIGSQVRRVRARRDELAPRRASLLNDRQRLLG